MPRAGLTREKVIEKAAELADERGIDGVTITTLAEYLGIRKPSLYNHIEGPEDVRTQIMLYGWRYLSGQAVEGTNITDAKHSIERSMDLLVTAFENQLDKLFQADALDVNADIAALEGMLNLDGLTGSEFTR